MSPRVHFHKDSSKQKHLENGLFLVSYGISCQQKHSEPNLFLVSCRIFCKTEQKRVQGLTHTPLGRIQMDPCNLLRNSSPGSFNNLALKFSITYGFLQDLLQALKKIKSTFKFNCMIMM